MKLDRKNKLLAGLVVAAAILIGKIFYIQIIDELIYEIEQLGGKVVSSISKKTDYLLLGKNPGSKLEKAIKLGTKIIKNISEIL